MRKHPSFRPFQVIIWLCCFATWLSSGGATEPASSAHTVGWEETISKIAVQPDTEWVAYADEPWLSVAPDSGKGFAEVVVTIAENSSVETRIGRVHIGETVYTFTQSGRRSSRAAFDASAAMTFSSFSLPAADVLPPAMAATVTGDVYRIDPSFSVQLERNFGELKEVVSASDGGFWLVGYFTSLAGEPRRSVAKLRADLALDTAFKPVGLSFDGVVTCVDIQPDGKLVLGGNFSSFNGVSRNGVARLNADGSLDASFNPGMGFSAPTSGIAITGLSLQADGKVVVIGSFSTFNSSTRRGIARLNADGSLDATFNPAGTGFSNVELRVLAVQPDSKILVGGNFASFNGTASNRIARLNTDGSLDTSFVSGTGFNGPVNSIALQADGRIIAGGLFSAYSGASRGRIARLLANGALDTTFSPGAGFNDSVSRIVITSGGQIVAGGFFTSYNGVSRRSVARLNADGALDTAFNPSGTSFGSGDSIALRALLVRTDGSLVMVGATQVGDTRDVLVTMLANGSVSVSTPPGYLRVGDLATRAYPLSTGAYLVAGNFEVVSGVARARVARLTQSGTPDAAFAPSVLDDVRSIAASSDGRVWVGGGFLTVGSAARSRIARLTANGLVDTSFTPGTGFTSETSSAVLVDLSFVSALTLQSDGRLLMGGSFDRYDGVARNGLARFNPDGTLDSGFNAPLFLGVGAGINLANPSNPYDRYSIRAFAVQPDGKILAGGRFTSFNGTPRGRIVRLNFNGSLDTSLDSGIGFNDDVEALAVQADGKVVAVGAFSTFSGTPRSGIARLNADGSLDTTFNPGSGFGNRALGLAIQADGKILVGGWFRSFKGIANRGLVRLNSDGSLDTAFALIDVVEGDIYHIEVTSSGGLLLSGPSGVRGAVLQDGLVLLRAESGAPVFTTQPANATAAAGAAVTLTALAEGTPTPTYQWFKGTTALAGQTAASLTFTSVTAADAGPYRVTATNSGGTATSNDAVLTVTAVTPPTTPQPPTTPAPGGGGGGAMSLPLLATVLMLAAWRQYARRQR